MGDIDPRLIACAKALWDHRQSLREHFDGSKAPSIPFKALVPGRRTHDDVVADARDVIREWLRQPAKEAMLRACLLRELHA